MFLKSHLSKPKTNIDLNEGQFFAKIPTHTAVMQGWRKNLQDRVVTLQLTPEVAYAAVFDGHGGPEVAEYLARTFHREIQNQPFFKLRNYQKALFYTFKRIDEMLLSQRGEKDIRAIQKELKVQISPLQRSACFDVGTTAHVLLITSSKIYSASIGDSRAILCRNKVAIPLSQDHKPFHSYEQERIQKAGGFVKNGRINGGLNLSRAFGDFCLKSNQSKPYNEQMLTCIPSINQFERTVDDQFIFMASDGVWDFYKNNNQKFVKDFNFLEKKNNFQFQQSICQFFRQSIMGTTLNAQTGLDNMSAVYIKF